MAQPVLLKIKVLAGDTKDSDFLPIPEEYLQDEIWLHACITHYHVKTKKTSIDYGYDENLMQCINQIKLLGTPHLTTF